jgi:hypothetical protein
MLSKINTSIANDITARLRNGEHFGNMLPLLVNPFEQSQRNMRTVIIDEYVTDFGYERCLKAGPFHTFRKGDIVATLRGRFVNNDTKPEIPSDMPSTTWMFKVQPDMWIFIDEPEFGYYGNLINCTLGPRYGPDQHTNCTYHYSGTHDDGRAYVSIRALHTIKPFDQFFVAYGKEGTVEVRTEYQALHEASMEADTVRDKVFLRLLQNLVTREKHHSHTNEMEYLSDVDNHMIHMGNANAICSDIDDEAAIPIEPMFSSQSIRSNRYGKKLSKSGNQGYNGK